MPIYFKVFEEHKLVVLLPTGITSDEDFVSFYTRFSKDDRISPEYALLVDTTREEGSPGVDAIRKVAAAGQQIKRERREPSKIAIIAPSDLTFGTTRWYQSNAETSEGKHRVFRKAQAAVDWLGIPLSILDDAREATGQG